MPNMNNMTAWPGLDWVDQDPTKPLSADRMESLTDAVEEGDLRNPLSPASKTADKRYVRKDARSIDVRDFGALGTWDRATESGPMDTDAFAAALQAASDRKLPLYYGPDALGRANFCIDLDAVDKWVDIDPASRGTIYHPKSGNALRISHTMGPERDVTSTPTNVWVRNNDTGTSWQVYPEITVAAADMLADNPQQGDVFTIASGDAIPGDFLSNGLSTWQKEWLSVLARGLDVTDVGTADTDKLLQGQRIVGQNSHASAVVASKVQSQDGAIKVSLTNVVHGDNGTFQAGENLLVNGIVKGTVTARAPYLIAAGLLVHNYVTAPRLQKGRTDLRTNITGMVIAASGDPDQMLEALEGPNTGKRQPAILIENVVRLYADVHVKDSWRSGIECRGTYLGFVRLRVDKLPGYAEDEEAGWGYGLCLMGACDRMTVECPLVTNCRHGVSSNVRPQNARPADDGYRTTAGVSHYVTISGKFHYTTDASVDQHGGSFGWVLKKAEILSNGSFGRTQARGAGVQVRGFGFLCDTVTIDGTTDGVRDMSMAWPTPFAYRNVYRNMTLRNIRRYGYNLTAGSAGSEANGQHRIVIEKSSCDFANLAPGLVTGANRNPNEQLHVYADFGRLELTDVTTRVGNTAAGRFGALDELIIMGGLTDHSTQTTSTTTWNCESATKIPLLSIVNHLVRGGPLNAGSSVVRCAGAFQDIYTAGCGNINQSNTFAFATATAGNTINVISIKEAGVNLAAQVSNYDPPLLTAGTTSNLAVAVPGAAPGDFALPSFTGVHVAGVTWTAVVTAVNEVTVSIRNSTATDQNLGLGNLRVRVWK